MLGGLWSELKHIWPVSGICCQSDVMKLNAQFVNQSHLAKDTSNFPLFEKLFYQSLSQAALELLSSEHKYLGWGVNTAAF